jgi:hypothetical protein
LTSGDRSATFCRAEIDSWAGIFVEDSFMGAMHFLDELTATYLALLAEDPEENLELLDRLKGDALKIGEAVVGRKGASEDPNILKAAAQIRAWSSRSCERQLGGKPPEIR